MILIISEDGDLSTKKMADWLCYYKEKYLILTYKDEVSLDIGTDGNYLLIINNEPVSINDIKSVYYRRSWVRFQLPIDNPEENDRLKKYNIGFQQNLFPFFNQILKKIGSIGEYGNGNFNKLLFLETCVELGIDIPPYALVSSKKGVRSFVKLHGDIITKSITIPYYYYDSEKVYAGYTHKFSAEEIENLPDKFKLSFIQKCIEKRMELRFFFLKGACYAMAILSPNSEVAQVDFRLGYGDNKMRMCSIQVPQELELKMKKLMEKLNHNVGSVDVIYGTDGKYYFLELNPVGQYDWLSENCGYNLDKIIANELRK